MNDEQRAMYTAAISLRNTEVTLRWTRTQLFFLIHSAGLSFVVTQFKEGSAVRFGSCLLGLVLVYLWWRLTMRIQHWVIYWNSKLAALERLEPIQEIRIFGGREYIHATGGIGTHDIILGLISVFLVAWLSLAITALAAL